MLASQRFGRSAFFFSRSRGLATQSTNLLILGDESSFDAVKASPGKKVYYFTATWCPPCRAIAPVFEAISKTKPDITFVKIDVDQLPGAAQEFDVTSIPKFFFLVGEKRLAQCSGAVEASLKHFVDMLDKE